MPTTTQDLQPIIARFTARYVSNVRAKRRRRLVALLAFSLIGLGLVADAAAACRWILDPATRRYRWVCGVVAEPTPEPLFCFLQAGRRVCVP